MPCALKSGSRIDTFDKIPFVEDEAIIMVKTPASKPMARGSKRPKSIEIDTDLIEFSLATVALEDNFAETFKGSRGKVDPKLKLGFFANRRRHDRK